MGKLIKRVGSSEAQHVSYLTNLSLTISSPVKKTNWARGEPGGADGLGSPVKITTSSYRCEMIGRGKRGWIVEGGEGRCGVHGE